MLPWTHGLCMQEAGHPLTPIEVYIVQAFVEQAQLPAPDTWTA